MSDAELMREELRLLEELLELERKAAELRCEADKGDEGEPDG